MDFGLSEEQTLFQDTLNNFLADQVSLERVRRIAGGDESAGAVWAELAELGVSALLVPEERGGVGLKPLDAAIAAECLGYHATPAPSSAPQSWGRRRCSWPATKASAWSA